MKRIASIALTSVLAASSPVWAHSVAQVQTALRIARSTAVEIDPQGRPGVGGEDSDTAAQVGDILTFIIQFTPLPNNATRGAGGYITVYIPDNTSVVGARLIDNEGNTVTPRRGGQMNDGYGPRGRHGDFDTLGVEQGSLAQLYADTGIFYSTSSLTQRVPADAFLSVTNGLVINPAPTGAGQLDNFLAFTGPPFHSHNQWDLDQALAFGVNGGSLGLNGTGNTPHLFGSAVAGPQTHYSFGYAPTPECSDAVDNGGDPASDYPDDPGCASALDDDETTASDGAIGPWQRIRYWGSETGQGVALDATGTVGRIGVLTDLGVDLSVDDPLPASANALRFAVGELIVGQEYFAEFSLRVEDLPLDSVMDADVVCGEVFGGDAAQPQNGQDNAWRYYVASPACAQLNLLFELSVDKLLAVQGDTLTYTIQGKNLSTNPQTSVVVSDTFDDGDVSFVSTLLGPAPTVGNGTLTWPAMDLDPGEEYEFQWSMTVTGNQLSTLNRATYTSDALPTPGFSVVALTDIESIIVIGLAAEVATNPATNPPSTNAGEIVHYTVTVTNAGTGDATLNGNSFVAVTLPTDFTYCSTDPCVAPTINGVAVADPTIVGNVLTFTTGLADVPSNGGTLTLELDATLENTVSADEHRIGVQTQFRDDGIGRDVENQTLLLAPLLVDIEKSEAPTLDDPLLAGSTSVTGTTSEGQGALVTVYLNGNDVGTDTAGALGAFEVTVPSLFAGQRVTASAQALGEISSDRAPESIVVGVSDTTACGDDLDNDGDGLTDFPDDPGCESGYDVDETDIPECSDGVDNDNNGDTDFPDDIGCSAFTDASEDGEPACDDGADNDGDNATDFPDDPGCESATDSNESDIPSCADGIDNDDDGDADFPADIDCASSLDDSEAGVGADGGSEAPPDSDASAAGGSLNGGVIITQGDASIPDLGSVPLGMGGMSDGGGLGAGTGSGADTGSDSGCSCRTVGGTVDLRWNALLVVLALGVSLARRRSSRAVSPATR
ncbi:MAG TPA: hypothetical protein VHO25_14565 [Polyangiaceae bacterium]|nr:hypothetical protein [Polyangiaceae bacterium]